MQIRGNSAEENLLGSKGVSERGRC